MQQQSETSVKKIEITFSPDLEIDVRTCFAKQPYKPRVHKANCHSDQVGYKAGAMRTNGVNSSHQSEVAAIKKLIVCRNTVR